MGAAADRKDFFAFRSLTAVGKKIRFLAETAKSQREPFAIFCFGAAAGVLGYVCFTINPDIQNGSPGVSLIALLCNPLNSAGIRRPQNLRAFFSFPVKSTVYLSITAIPVAGDARLCASVTSAALRGCCLKSNFLDLFLAQWRTNMLESVGVCQLKSSTSRLLIIVNIMLIIAQFRAITWLEFIN